MVATAHRTELTGRVLMNKLRVIRLLGEGGMGAVYEVEHLITRHRRALKVMHSSFASSPDTIARFVREAGVAGTLKTPHVVETYDAGQLDDGSPYVLMEMLEGRTLGALFESGETTSVGRLVGLICQVLEGLDVAHRAGIIHRDIKPDNVFVGVGPRGMPRVTLLDFGISKFLDNQFDVDGSQTAEGTMMGTPYYMSLEQATGRTDIDPRSDLYSVGVMLYEGLVGHKPYEATSLTALVVKIHDGDHEPVLKAAPHLPPALAAVVEKAMAIKRDDRYPTASELLAALVPYADSRYVVSLHTLQQAGTFDSTMDGAASAPAPEPRVATPAETAPRSAPIWPKAAAVLLLLALGGAAYVTTRTPPSSNLISSEPIQVQARPNPPAAAEDPALAAGALPSHVDDAPGTPPAAPEAPAIVQAPPPVVPPATRTPSSRRPTSERPAAVSESTPEAASEARATEPHTDPPATQATPHPMGGRLDMDRGVFPKT